MLSQTFGEFELIVVDDGSTDNTCDVLGRFGDRRVRRVRLGSRYGPSHARNVAISAARGRYIAILDADDLAYSNRLQTQVAYMEAHPEVGICGHVCHRITESGEVVGTVGCGLNTLESHWRLTFENCLVHSSIMLRHTVLVSSGVWYSARFPQAQDYDLYSRLRELSHVVALSETLGAWRYREGSATQSHRHEQEALALAVAQRNLAYALAQASIDVVHAPQLLAWYRGRCMKGPGLKLFLADVYLTLLRVYLSQHNGTSVDPVFLRRYAGIALRRIPMRAVMRPAFFRLVRKIACLPGCSSGGALAMVTKEGERRARLRARSLATRG